MNPLSLPRPRGEDPDTRSESVGYGMELTLDRLYAVSPPPVPLIVCGVERADLASHHPSARRIEVMGLHAALRLPDPPLVVVLGDEPLRRLRSASMGPRLRRQGFTALAVARACPAHVVAAWVRDASIDFVPPERLSRRVAEAIRTDRRIYGEGAPRASPGRRDEMREALQVLRHLEDCSVKAWAYALGMDRHALRRLCVETVHCNPEDIAWAFFDSRVRREIRNGRTDVQIARALGMAGTFALHRAYTRRGFPFPAR